MCPRIFLFLLVSVTSLYAEDSDNPTATTMEIHFKETWETATVPILAEAADSTAGSGAETVSLAPGLPSTAKRAQIEVRDAKDRPYEFRVFAVKMGAKTWIGPEQQLYLRTSRGPLGISVAPGGFLSIWESLVSENNSRGKESELEAFSKNVDGARLLEPTAMIDLREGLNPFFFASAPYSMEAGQATIEGASYKGDILSLRLRSSGGDYRALITVDVRTEAVTSAKEDGREVLPTR